MRQCANNLFVKILLSIIALALVWGFGDFSNKSNSEYVASIDGKYHITRAEFNQAKNFEIKKFQNFLGDLSDQQLQTLNIDNFILKKLINNKLIEAETDSLKLYVSNKTAVKQIKEDPIFFGSDNKFDVDKFHKLLSSNNIIENKYIESVKGEISAKYLISAISGQSMDYKNIASYLNKFDNQNRVIDLIEINIDKIKLDEIINIDELETYYKDHQNEFKIPSIRSFSMIKFDNDSFKEDLIVNESELNEYYESNKNDFLIEEKRDIYNFTFKDKEEANKFLYKLNKEKIDLKQYRKSLIKNANKTDLPLNLQGIAFSLDAGKHSEILENGSDYNILFIEDIKSPNSLILKDVYKDIQKILTTNKSEEILNIKINEIEDAIAAGSTIAEISKNFKLKLTKLENLTQEDLSKNKYIADFHNIATIAFSNDNGFISNIINDDKGNYILFSIDDVKDEKTKSFDNVKNEIQKKLILLEKEKIARNLFEKLKDNKNKTEIPSQATLSQITLTYNQKNEFSNLIDNDLFEEIYSLRKDEFSNIFNYENKLVIAYLKDVINGDNQTNLNQINNELKEISLNLITEEYLAYLNKKHKVKIYN